MIPRKRFDGWIDTDSWGLAIAINFIFKKVWLNVGPLNGSFFWGKL